MESKMSYEAILVRIGSCESSIKSKVSRLEEKINGLKDTLDKIVLMLEKIQEDKC